MGFSIEGGVWVQGEEHPDYSKACVRAHNGAIISLQRSPFFEDVLLSVGDWSCALWKEGQHQSPLFTSPHAPAPYTAGCWSPTRPGPPTATATHTHTHPSAIVRKGCGVLEMSIVGHQLT